MTAPNIATIAASLRSCSLRERRPPSPPLPADENGGITVELNSEVPLPYHWEQCLDIRTGEVYYINWRDGRRTTEDPRMTSFPESYYSSEDDDDSSDEGSSSGEDEDDDDTTTTGEDEASGFLVAAGCKACFMYFMVPKGVEECPKCAGVLLYLTRNACF